MYNDLATRGGLYYTSKYLYYEYTPSSNRKHSRGGGGDGKTKYYRVVIFSSETGRAGKSAKANTTYVLGDLIILFLVLFLRAHIFQCSRTRLLVKSYYKMDYNTYN